ncbi:MAG: biotin-dependent carboxyltransferase family protein [Alphaproteobacteria bacterium]
MALRLNKIGPGASLQDKGRLGWQRYGVSASGPMDWLAASTVNRIVGNSDEVPVLELDQMGVVCEAQTDCHIGVCAPMGTATINGDDVFPTSRFLLRAGDRLTLAPSRQGGWAYLATAGGFIGNTQLGSVSFHRRAGLGGPALSAGDCLHSNASTTPTWQPASYPLFEALYTAAENTPLHIILGPQDDMLTTDSITQFCDGAYRLSLQCDRMGYRLTGPPMQHKGAADIVSDGIAMGTVQVPGDGHPIILMADRQTSGGYPKLGTLITADLPRLAQSAMGNAALPLHFATICPDDAIARLKRLYHGLEQALSKPQQIGPRTPTTDILLRENLIDGTIADF